MPGRKFVGKQRLLVLVIAYEAEATIESVLDRIPGSVLHDFDCEVLVVDDASTDATVSIGRGYAQRHLDLPVVVLKNRINQGYGGNQKVGYTYAIEGGFDVVAMIHGDGQYAPEALPSLLAPLTQDAGVGAVFGSRMLEPGGARRGGMPRYKFVGNRILSTVQNALLRTSFSEFHSGYRVYRVQALESVHYQLNTSDFHFDTQIILQLLAAGWGIEERPIPTYYGDEISRVNGVAYAFNVIKATLQFFLHRLGLRQQRRFDPVAGDPPYKPKFGFPSSHQWALDAVPTGSRVLDFGSGPGYFADELVAKGCTVTCIDRVAPDHVPDGVAVIVDDLEGLWTFNPADYDVMLLMDVLEHLKRPEEFLDRLRAHLDHRRRTVIVTTGNVAFIATRLSLLAGQFNYGARGILDRDHSRLFTFRTLRHLMRDAGLRTEEVRGIPAPFPLAIGDGRLSRLLLNLNLLLIRVSKRMFSFQIFAVATTTPDLAFLVRDAHAHLDEEAAAVIIEP